ncbi:bifunctional diaminohydroxyphosphoribosylaminopyrimidine deaminase/5-amino-6-(5-phosphoribosylamino)uracil reductase RibD [Thermovibrio sp.]
MWVELSQDEWFMKLAIAEAYRGKGKTLPNPAVGAVVVKEGKVIATGYHRKAGLPHAERVALEKAGREAEGSTLYVTLEPCNHYGRTPPCTEAIIRAGVKRVVIGVRDPNPVASGGVERLKEAGIEVDVGVLESECRELIEDFVFNLKSARPFVSLKLASTLDGAIADRSGSSKWITGKEARAFVHRLRSWHNAVMVGIGTVLKDDPLLTVREYPVESQPLAVIVDPKLKIPTNCRLVKERASELIVITDQSSLLTYKAGILRDLGVRLLPVFGVEGVIDLAEALTSLKEELGVYSVLCEGGSSLAGRLLENSLVDKLYLFYAPKVLGGSDFIPLFGGSSRRLGEAFGFELFGIEVYGSDVLLKLYPRLGG